MFLSGKALHSTSATVAVLVAAALGLSACNEEKAAEAKPVIRPVKVIEIASADTVRRLDYSGSVKSRTEMTLGFRVAGKITERLVDVGERVEPGQVVARIDATDLRLAVESAQANLTAAQKAVETTDLANKRAQALHARNAVPQAQVEQAQLSYDQAVSSRTAASAALDQARNQLAYAELRADRAGMVATVSADRGQVVAIGAPVLTVVADDEKEVLIAVPENDIAVFKVGKPVGVRFWADEKLALAGKVREVSGSADPQSRTFSVRVSLPDDPRVLIGMTATVLAEAGRAGAPVAVPLSALAEKDGAKIVWTVDRKAETVHARAVTLADFTGEGVGVSAGLNPGDLVVSAGTQFMNENLKVKLPDIVGRIVAADAMN